MSITWAQNLKQTRIAYGVTQEQLAECTGISRQYLSKIESGKTAPSDNTRHAIMQMLEYFNPNKQLEVLVDYCRVRFQRMSVEQVIRSVLQLKMQFFAYDERGFWGYDEQYALGDMVVMVSQKEELGVMLEFKGKGCRQFETYLNGQGRNWIDFFRDCLKADAIFKRLDLAINDKIGMLDIPFLAGKCSNEECISVFRDFKDYASGGLIRRLEPNEKKLTMGRTLYIGSMKSDVYFCMYEKDYEQYIKNYEMYVEDGISREDMEIKNRFEIRLKSERAENAIYDLVAYEDAERTVFGIINRYMRFVDRDEMKERKEWETNAVWARFMGQGREKVKLATAPEPYTLERSRRWYVNQVAPTLKMLMEVDAALGTQTVSTSLDLASLSERQQRIVDAAIVDGENIILGLKWNAVDFENGTITVKTQLQKEKRKGGEHYISNTKNSKPRVIMPAPYVMRLLRSQRAKQLEAQMKIGAAWNNEWHLVFTNETGRHLIAVTVYKDFKKHADAIGMPDTRFHDLRHSYAVAALQSGDDIKTVQNNLGHHTAAFTLDVYGHVTERMKKESADRMESYINSISNL